jgi:hypothetical protein
MKIITALVLLLSACFLAACQTAVIPVVPTTPPTLTAAPAATPNAEQSRTTIIAGLLAMALKASHMEVTTAQADGTTLKSVVEFLPPDRKYVAGDGSEFIIAGGKVYMKTASQAWIVTPVAASQFIPDPPTADGVGQMVSDARVLRTELLNGKEVRVYGFTNTAKSGDLSAVSQAELWVSLEDGLPVKFITDGETFGMSTDSNGSSKMVKAKVVNTTLIDFKAPVKIEVPMP